MSTQEWTHLRKVVATICECLVLISCVWGCVQCHKIDRQAQETRP